MDFFFFCPFPLSGQLADGKHTYRKMSGDSLVNFTDGRSFPPSDGTFWMFLKLPSQAMLEKKNVKLFEEWKRADTILS